MKNILIGVGGTGAKVVEATLVLLATGGAQGTVHVGLVDQDEANGNVGRTARLISRLCNFQHEWTLANNLIVANADDAPLLGSLRIEPLFGDADDRATWPPNPEAKSLGDIMGKNLEPRHQKLFDMLFMANEHEQELELGIGYRGRAHVGSAAITASIAADSNRFIARMADLMTDDEHGDVNIFLVGSSFGGTGAAGFPTLARKLHRMRTNADEQRPIPNGQNITLGGMLLLPYFSFANPENKNASVVSNDELMPKAQLALEYYENLFRREHTFNRFYVLGWNPLFNLGYHNPGSDKQENPPLPPELVAATAALDFFRTMERPGDREPDTERLLSVRKGDALHWHDLPWLAGANQGVTKDPSLEDRCAQLLRFAVYWRYRFEPMLRVKKTFGFSNWEQKLAGNPDINAAQRQLATVNELIDAILLWAATVEWMAGRQGRTSCWSPGLWTLQGLLKRDYNPGEPEKFTRPVLLAEPHEVTEDEVTQAFNALYRNDDTNLSPRGASMVNEELKMKAPGGSQKGIAKALTAVYHACRIRD